MRIFYLFLIMTIVWMMPGYCQFEIMDDNRQLVNNVFYETDIRQALQDISAQVKVPIVIGPSVEGFINIELNNVPLEEALTMVLIPLGYTFKKVDTYYVVGLARPESPVFNLLAKTEAVNLDYVKAEDAKDLVSDFFHPYIKANPHNNSITITAPQNIIARFKDDMRKIDQPRQQVMMEALVVEISEAGKRELGIRWGSMQEGGFTVSPPSNFSYENYVGSNPLDQFEFSGTVTQSTLLTLKTMIQKGKAAVRANPRISALDGEQASIFIGKEEFFLINIGSAAFPQNTLQSIDTGVTLNVTPTVSSRGAITVKIEPEVSEAIGTGSGNLPIVNRRTVSTTVRVFDGDTIVIGGLAQHTSSQTNTKAPVLGSIPILGSLFKSNDVESEDKEVLIFITPHLSDIDRVFREVVPEDIPLQTRTFFARNQQSRRSLPHTSSAGLRRVSVRYEGNRYFSKDVFRQQSYLLNRYLNYVSDILNSADVNDLLLSLYDRDVINREVLVTVTVSRNGYVEGVRILRPSGSRLIDTSIRDAILKASPLPKFPAGLPKDNLELSMTFRLG